MDADVSLDVDLLLCFCRRHLRLLTASEIFPLETRLILGAAPIEALFGIDAEGLSLGEIADLLSSQ
jgi:hypothetical protein